MGPPQKVVRERCQVVGLGWFWGTTRKITSKTRSDSSESTGFSGILGGIREIAAESRNRTVSCAPSPAACCRPDLGLRSAVPGRQTPGRFRQRDGPWVAPGRIRSPVDRLADGVPGVVYSGESGE